MIFDKYGYETIEEMSSQAEFCHKHDNGLYDDDYYGYDDEEEKDEKDTKQILCEQGIKEGYRVITDKEFWELSNKFSKKELDDRIKFAVKKFVRLLEDKCNEKEGYAYSFGNIKNIVYNLLEQFVTEVKQWKR